MLGFAMSEIHGHHITSTQYESLLEKQWVVPTGTLKHITHIGEKGQSANFP